MPSFLGFIQSAFRGACILCDAAASESALCAPCSADLPFASGLRCPVCAVPTPVPAVCGRCVHQPPHFDRVVTALDYLTPVDYLVGELKYGKVLAAARTLASALIPKLGAETRPDLVLPMPMAATRMQERGFNQATEIARHVSAKLGITIKANLAQRQSAAVSQTALPWRDRARNVRGAFRCDIDLKGKSVAVIDDVLTTGATLDEVARTLKQAGATEVIGWIAARTPPHS